MLEKTPQHHRLHASLDEPQIDATRCGTVLSAAVRLPYLGEYLDY